MSNEATKAITLVQYMKSPEIMEKFVELLGASAKSYVQSVLIATYMNKELSECTHKSIASAALRAASLRLSCDPTVRQAHLVPYNRKVKERVMQDGREVTIEKWVKEASFQAHYNGLYTLAMRTNFYRVINVSPVHKDWEVMENFHTGLHAILIPGLGRLDDGYMPRRRVEPEQTQGWLGYFETVKGFKKSVYMTVDEIEEHARKFSKSYANPSSLWKNQEHRPTMQMKTVLRALLRWADLSGSEHELLNQALAETDNVIDGVAEDLPDDAEVTVTSPGQRRSEADGLSDLGYSQGNGKGFEPMNRKSRTPETLKYDLGEDAKVERGMAGDGKLGLLVSIVDKAIGKDGRYDFTEWLFGLRSSTKLTDNQVHALWQWLNPAKDSDTGEWIPDLTAIAELMAAHEAAMKANGQAVLPQAAVMQGMERNDAGQG